MCSLLELFKKYLTENKSFGFTACNLSMLPTALFIFFILLVWITVRSLPAISLSLLLTLPFFIQLSFTLSFFLSVCTAVEPETCLLWLRRKRCYHSPQRISLTRDKTRGKFFRWWGNWITLKFEVAARELDVSVLSPAELFRKLFFTWSNEALKHARSVFAELHLDFK